MTRPTETSRDLTLPFATDSSLRRRFMVVPVILRVNRINFLQPVRMGDKLHLVSRVVYTGSTSICVEVSIAPVYPTTYAENARFLEAHRRNRRHWARPSHVVRPSAAHPPDNPDGARDRTS